MGIILPYFSLPGNAWKQLHSNITRDVFVMCSLYAGQNDFSDLAKNKISKRILTKSIFVGTTWTPLPPRTPH
jgi:hypothetical protein